jgi:hypothetical protein
VERSDTHQLWFVKVMGIAALHPSYELRLYSVRNPASSILNPMTEDDPTDEISAIEARIEELAEIAERCRKFILASKIAIATGVALPIIMMLGSIGASQVAALGSIALVLGGIVSLGSNVSTLRQTETAISAAEALRSELIGRIDPRVVDDAPMKLM